MTYYIYLLRCQDGSLYTGITTDLARRLAEHRGKGGRGAKYTAARRPLGLEAAWRTEEGRGAASRLESRIKRLSHREKEQLISGALALPLEGYARAELPEAGNDPAV